MSILRRVGDYLGLIRFSHTIFALPFAATAGVLALAMPLPGSGSGSGPDFASVRVREVVALLLAMVAARSAAMAFNRWVDARIDAANPRTVSRHIPAGVISSRAAIGFTAACCVAFVASTALFLPNRLPLLLSLPVLLFLLGYSLAKRFTSAAHLWLGVALALSPICVWVAIRGEDAAAVMIDYAVPLSLAVVVIAWVTGFDILYACQDADYDADAGLHSVPSRFGQTGAMRIAAVSHAVMFPGLFALGWFGRDAGLGWIYAVAVAVIAGLVVRQHRLVRPGELGRINEAFFQTNAIISVVLLVAVAADVFVR